MANTSVIRLAGPTTTLTVTTSEHSSVTINDSTNDQVNYASFLNAGAYPCAIKFTPGTATAAANAVFATDGNTGDFVLPALMETPVVLAVPTTPFYLTAIASGGTTALYVTPVADQS